MKKIHFGLLIVLSFILCSTITALVQGTSTSDKTAGTSFTAAYSVTAVTGNLYVLTISNDNLGSGSDGDKGDITSVTDNAGHTYTKAAEFSNVQSGAASGATVSIWYVILTANLSGKSYTINFSGSVTCKCVLGNAFSLDAGSTIAIEGSPGTLANDGADAGSITLSSLPSREYLFFRATAVEANAVTGTASTNFTGLGSGNATTGGGSAANMGLQSERRIVTATSQTTDPTTGSADCASIMVAFYEVAAASPHSRRITIIQ